VLQKLGPPGARVTGCGLARLVYSQRRQWTGCRSSGRFKSTLGGNKSTKLSLYRCRGQYGKFCLNETQVRWQRKRSFRRWSGAHGGHLRDTVGSMVVGPFADELKVSFVGWLIQCQGEISRSNPHHIEDLQTTKIFLGERY
jgi:hypothetical protein